MGFGGELTISRLGGGFAEPLRQINIFVINSAANWLPELIGEPGHSPDCFACMNDDQRKRIAAAKCFDDKLEEHHRIQQLIDFHAQYPHHFLIVDEAHRATAPTFRRIFEVARTRTLLLTATFPSDEEKYKVLESAATNPDPIDPDLGAMLCLYKYPHALKKGNISDFNLSYHMVALTDNEQDIYDTISALIDDFRAQASKKAKDSDPDTMEMMNNINKGLNPDKGWQDAVPEYFGEGGTYRDVWKFDPHTGQLLTSEEQKRMEAVEAAMGLTSSDIEGKGRVTTKKAQDSYAIFMMKVLGGARARISWSSGSRLQCALDLLVEKLEQGKSIIVFHKSVNGAAALYKLLYDRGWGCAPYVEDTGKIFPKTAEILELENEIRDYEDRRSDLSLQIKNLREFKNTALEALKEEGGEAQLRELMKEKSLDPKLLIEAELQLATIEIQEKALVKKRAGVSAMITTKEQTVRPMIWELYKNAENVKPGRDAIGIYHSQLPPQVRGAYLNAFKTGEIKCLISVQALLEGLDVPHCDVGVAVAADQSDIKIVQALGRVLRISPDSKDKKEYHFLCAAGTKDLVVRDKFDKETSDENSRPIIDEPKSISGAAGSPSPPSAPFSITDVERVELQTEAGLPTTVELAGFIQDIMTREADKRGAEVPEDKIKKLEGAIHRNPSPEKNDPKWMLAGVQPRFVDENTLESVRRFKLETLEARLANGEELPSEVIQQMEQLRALLVGDEEAIGTGMGASLAERKRIALFLRLKKKLLPSFRSVSDLAEAGAGQLRTAERQVRLRQRLEDFRARIEDRPPEGGPPRSGIDMDLAESMAEAASKRRVDTEEDLKSGKDSVRQRVRINHPPWVLKGAGGTSEYKYSDCPSDEELLPEPVITRRPPRKSRKRKPTPPGPSLFAPEVTEVVEREIVKRPPRKRRRPPPPPPPTSKGLFD